MPPPRAIRTVFAAQPPRDTRAAQARRPSSLREDIQSQPAARASKSGGAKGPQSGAEAARGRTRHTVKPLPGKAAPITRRESTAQAAKAIRVGGTSISSKLPLMLSLPPIAGSPHRRWTVSAPRRAARGRPQDSGPRSVRPKYSCRLKRTSRQRAPTAQTAARASIRAY